MQPFSTHDSDSNDTSIDCVRLLPPRVGYVFVTVCLSIRPSVSVQDNSKTT